MVEWCAVGGGVISAVYTSLGLEMLAMSALILQHFARRDTRECRQM